MSAIVSRLSSAVLRTGGFAVITLLACAAGGPAGARAEAPLRAPAAAPSGLPSVQLALTESEIARCRAMQARLRSRLSSYRSRCSGRLSAAELARCREIKARLDRDIAIHNAQCR